MERRVRPWINKKIIEYIGEEEATLVDFVCSKVIVMSLVDICLRGKVEQLKCNLSDIFFCVLSGDGPQYTADYLG